MIVSRFMSVSGQLYFYQLLAVSIPESEVPFLWLMQLIISS